MEEQHIKSATGFVLHDGIKITGSEVKYKLVITDGFALNSIYPPPNRFYRFMMHMLLGWKFEIAIPNLRETGKKRPLPPW